MSRERLCRQCRKWHPVDNWPAECMPKASSTRSSLPTPMLNLDTMDPVQSQLDGKMYDSKAKLRETYKAAGVTEVGNDSSVLDPKPRPKPKVDRKAIRNSVRKAAAQVGIST